MDSLSQDAKIKLIEYKMSTRPIIDLYSNNNEEKIKHSDKINSSKMYEYLNSTNDIVDINNLSFYKLKDDLSLYDISHVNPEMKGLTEEDFFDFDFNTSITHYNDSKGEPLICKYDKMKLEYDERFLNKKSNYYKLYKLDGSSNNLLNKILYDNIVTNYDNNILTGNTNLFFYELYRYRKDNNSLVKLDGDNINTIVDIKTGYVELLNDMWIRNKSTKEYFDYYITFFSYIGPLYKNFFNWNWNNKNEEFIYYKYLGNIGIHNKDPVEKIDVSGNIRFMDNRNFFRIESDNEKYKKMYEMIHENSLYENKNKQLNTQGIVYNNILVNKITKVSTSKYNSLFLNENGDVFSFGMCNNGRLGLGDQFLYKNENVPYRIESDIKFIDICHTSNNILLISSNNNLYGAGLTENNQLSEITFNTPISFIEKIDISNIKVKKISGGLNHTVIIDMSGCIWTCGSNKYGQLGYERDEHLLNLELLDEIYYKLFIDDNALFINNPSFIQNYGDDIKTKYKRLYLQDKLLTDTFNSIIPLEYYQYKIRNNSYDISSNETLEYWAEIDISGVKSINVKINELINFMFNISITKSVDNFIEYLLSLSNLGKSMTIRNFLILFKDLLLSYLDFYRYKKISIFEYGNNKKTAILPEIIDVQCGEYSTYILDNMGRVYACGKNDGGQLGIYNVQYNFNIHSNIQSKFKRIDFFLNNNNVENINEGLQDIWLRDGSIYNIKDLNNNLLVGFTKQITNNITSIQNSPPNVLSIVVEKNIPSLIIVTFDKILNNDRNLEVIKNNIEIEKNSQNYTDLITRIEIIDKVLKVYCKEDFKEQDTNLKIKFEVPTENIEDNLLMGINGYIIDYKFYDINFLTNNMNINTRLMDSYIDKRDDKKIILKFNKKIYYEDLSGVFKVIPNVSDNSNINIESYQIIGEYIELNTDKHFNKNMNNIFIINDNIKKLFNKIDNDNKGYITKQDMITFNTAFIQTSEYYEIDNNWSAFFDIGPQSIGSRYFDISNNNIYLDIDDFGVFFYLNNFKYNMKDNNNNFIKFANDDFRIRNELIDLEFISCEVYQKKPKEVEILFNNKLANNIDDISINYTSNNTYLNIVEKKIRRDKIIIIFNNNITYEDTITFNINNIVDINDIQFGILSEIQLNKINIFQLNILSVEVDLYDTTILKITFNKNIKKINQNDKDDFIKNFSITSNSGNKNISNFEYIYNDNELNIVCETNFVQGEQSTFNYIREISGIYIEDLNGNKLPISGSIEIINKVGDDIFPPECISIDVFDNERNKLILTFNENMETNTTIFNKYSFTLSDTNYTIESGTITNDKIHLLLNQNIEYGNLFDVLYTQNTVNIDDETLIHEEDSYPLLSSEYKVVQMSILGSQIHFLTQTNDVYFCGEILTEKYENYTPEEIILLFYAERSELFNIYYYSSMYANINPQSNTRLVVSMPIKYNKEDIFQNYSNILEIVQIGTGVESFFLVDISGEVYGLGSNDDEFISNLDGYTSELINVYFPNGSPMRNIDTISCGYYYNIFIDNIGNTYSHGMQTNGNLGLNTYQNVKNPEPIVEFKNLRGNYFNDYKTVNISSINSDKNLYIGGDLFSLSDRRIKYNIRDLSDTYALNIVNKLKPKYYEYIDNEKKGNGKTVGYIAQEVKDVFPEGVKIERYKTKTIEKIKNICWIKCDNKIYMTVCKNDYLINKYKIETNDISNLQLNIENIIEYDKYQLYINIDEMKCFNKIKTFYVGENENKVKKIYIIKYYFDKYTNLYFFLMNMEHANVYMIEEKVLEDFHFLQKEKIFTLHHSAIQELDRRQKNMEERRIKLEERIKKIEQKIN